MTEPILYEGVKFVNRVKSIRLNTKRAHRKEAFHLSLVIDPFFTVKKRRK